MQHLSMSLPDPNKGKRMEKGYVSQEPLQLSLDGYLFVYLIPVFLPLEKKLEERRDFVHFVYRISRTYNSALPVVSMP